MPVSHHEPYEAYYKWLDANKPRTLLDVGMGYGNLGELTKKILPDIELNGVEIFPPYLVHELSKAKLYKRILVGNALDFIDKLWPVDCIIAFDIIEHLNRQDGLRLINYLKTVSKMSVLVACPIIVYNQGEVNGNKAEAHLTHWKAEEMEALGGKPLFEGKICGLFEFKR